ncbi:MAG: ATP-dependent DNA helicase [Lachnospiraceae bacterium]|nr:ATP-dependent DNA helicase [Lachnospiraceae bacterium]
MEDGNKVQKQEIHISVRHLVEFLLRSGDIDNRRSAIGENAMQEGGRIHRMLQRRMGSGYHAEVTLKYTYESERYILQIEGRADGIMDGEIVTIDEIKGTYRELKRLREAEPVHLAQAKCYAFIYADQKRLSDIRVRMTYCNMDTEEVKYFYFDFEYKELEEWFRGLMKEYGRWAEFTCDWKGIRQTSIKGLQFPFAYRKGQKELATYVYQTIYHKKKLFIEAPTGAGKTISTLFPAVKAMGEELGDRIFYLTAKTITRTAAEDALRLLRIHGMKFKSVILTAKDKICFMEETECNPAHCPYAHGHYDRINEAVYEMLTSLDNFDREAIEHYAFRHRVCPYEMGLDMSRFADGIICDYNYVFDPHASLKRFFGEGVRGDYIFLIDEAHNLVERGREMYSASLCKEDFLQLKKKAKEEEGRLVYCLESCNKELLKLKRECEAYRIEEYIDPFVKALQRLHGAMEAWLEEREEEGAGEIGQESRRLRREVLEFYFQVSHFLGIYERVDEKYVVYSGFGEDGSFRLKLFCVNPSLNLREFLHKGRSSILFSATLLPIQYYKALLGAEEGDYEVYARSVFAPERRALFIGSDVTSRYTRRTAEEYGKIAAYIYETVKSRYGNYLIFFPSYAFLRQVYACFADCYLKEELIECMLQEEHMDEKAREEFLKRFEEQREKGLLGFCVMGGIFSEGIDLKRDSLIGTIIVGTGLPQVCAEREILKNYFDQAGEDGFGYAYRYPGMNKVLQAAGRVIRTAEDVGIVVLLDDRFLSRTYQRMFPREWEGFEAVTLECIAGRAEKFWKEWK